MGRVSSELIVSTGSPQACCLIPKLFTLHTSDCASTLDHMIIIKFADDTTILDLNKGGDEAEHRAVVNNTLVYGEENDLILNIDIVDFRMPELYVCVQMANKLLSTHLLLTTA